MILDQICKDVNEKTEFVKQQKIQVDKMKEQMQQMQLFKTALLTVASILETRRKSVAEESKVNQTKENYQLEEIPNQMSQRAKLLPE